MQGPRERGLKQARDMSKLANLQDPPNLLASRLASLSSVLGTTESRHVRKLAEISKDFLRTRFATCLNKSLQMPALQSFSCDTTPLSTREGFRHEWGPHLRITRRGRAAGHFNVLRVWLRCDAGCAVLLGEPQTLADSTAWTAFQAYLDTAQTLRQAGHRGLAISHHVEDRALHSAVGVSSRSWRRCEWSSGGRPKFHPHFSWTVLGGAWTMYHHDVAYDALQAKASTERGKMFTRRFGMNITCRFSLELRRDLLQDIVRVLGTEDELLLRVVGGGGVLGRLRVSTGRRSCLRRAEGFCGRRRRCD